MRHPRLRKMHFSITFVAAITAVLSHGVWAGPHPCPTVAPYPPDAQCTNWAGQGTVPGPIGGQPGGLGNPTCAGSDGNAHSDVLSCPHKDYAVDVICPSTFVMGRCNVINGTSVGCDSPNAACNNPAQCICINGNFCCDEGSQVPGGQSTVDYFKQEGCNCDGIPLAPGTVSNANPAAA